MLNLSQKIALQASVVGMRQFREMYDCVSSLIQHWELGTKCILVPCEDGVDSVANSNFREDTRTSDSDHDDTEQMLPVSASIKVSTSPISLPSVHAVETSSNPISTPVKTCTSPTSATIQVSDYCVESPSSPIFNDVSAPSMVASSMEVPTSVFSVSSADTSTSNINFNLPGDVRPTLIVSSHYKETIPVTKRVHVARGFDQWYYPY